MNFCLISKRFCPTLIEKYVQSTYFSAHRLPIICGVHKSGQVINRVSTKVDRYPIIKYVFALCISRSSRIRPNTYSARAQNMCNAHIFKVAYMCLLAIIICGVLIFFTDGCSIPNRWVCGHFPRTAAQNSSIMEFSTMRFCAWMTDFCQISLFSRWIFLSAGKAKFQYYGIFNGAVF